MAPANGHSSHDWPLRGELQRLEERNDKEHRRFEEKLDGLGEQLGKHGEHLARQDEKLDGIATRLDDMLEERRAERRAEQDAKLALQLEKVRAKTVGVTSRTKRWLAVLKVLGVVLGAVGAGVAAYFKAH